MADNIIILDGGMGQELRHRSDQPESPIWSAQILRDDPDLVRATHRDYIRAGADVIILNAYAATPQRLERRAGLGHLFEELQRGACQAALEARARESAETTVRIAGCLPPLVASYKPETTPDRDECLKTYGRIVELQTPSVDLFVCETMASAREAGWATEAAVKSGKPVWCSLTVIDEDCAKLRSGEPVMDGAKAAASAGAGAILLNCSRPEAISRTFKEFEGGKTPNNLPWGAYANGFTSTDALTEFSTTEVLEARKDLGPEVYADFVDDWIKRGATIVGGCCEVAPAHIAEIWERLRGSKDN